MTVRTNIVDCTPSEFFDLYMGGWAQVSDKGVEMIIEYLQKNGSLKGDVFTAFPGVESYPSNATIDDVWRPMETVFAAIAEAAEETMKGRFARSARTAAFQCNHSSKTFAEDDFPEERYLDGWTVLHDKAVHGTDVGSAYDTEIFDPKRPEGGRVWAADVGITAFFVPKDEQNSNVSETVGVASHILYNDRRRAFHIAFTVEGTQVRLWCHSRSFSAASSPFDVNEDCDIFIQFVLFATYAKEHQLGLDPGTARVVDVEGRLQYQYSVRPDAASDDIVIYQTIDVLSEGSADRGLYDRMMSVYHARCADRLGDGASVREDAKDEVLRDFAQPTHRPSESRIQRELIEEMCALAVDDAERKTIKESFVAIISDAASSFNVPKAAPKDQKLAMGMKERWTTVYGEKCEDLYSVKDPKRYFFALKRIVNVLNYFRRIGRVHRDISPGNIMLYLNAEEARWLVKIIDFEFSAKYDELPRWNGQTGTDHYMPIEIQTGRYLYLPETISKDASTRYEFRANFYHDLESVLWIALEFALHHRSYTKNSPMLKLMDLIDAMGKAHLEAQALGVGTEGPAEVEPTKGGQKRLPSRNFRSDVYDAFETVFDSISKYYEESGHTLVKVNEALMGRAEGVTSSGTSEATDVDSAEDSETSEETICPPRMRKSFAAPKRKATYDAEEDTKVKKPRVALLETGRLGSPSASLSQRSDEQKNGGAQPTVLDVEDAGGIATSRGGSAPRRRTRERE
ncbi:hypothetical protein HDZ31DRAFT_48000 [Schizophyllum fasciatum]